MSIVGFMPVRLWSSRLPGKPLKLIGNRTLLERTWAGFSTIDGVEGWVVTSDDVIEQLCKDNGIPVLFISQVTESLFCSVLAAYDHYGQREGWNEDTRCLIVPCSLPLWRRELVAPIMDSRLSNFDCVTPVFPIVDFDEFASINSVKVVLTDDNRPRYYSRAPLPFCLAGYDVSRSDEVVQLGGNAFSFKDIGVSLIRVAALRRICSSNINQFERVEDVHQSQLLNGNLSVLAVINNELVSQYSLEVNDSDGLKKAQAMIG
jgi:3-deoxy-manno-octulosonate cytidylyltransferase (CMP-KDO synthetase)